MATLADIDWSNEERIVLNPKLNERLDWSARPFLPTYSIPLDEATTERIADALALAVSKIAQTICRPHVVRLYFGRPPVYVVPVGTGLDIYVADMSQDPIATAGHDHIHLDAHRLAEMSTEPYDGAALCILEELVHSLLNIHGERIAKAVTASLLGGLVVIDETFYTLEQATAHFVGLTPPYDPGWARSQPPRGPTSIAEEDDLDEVDSEG